MQNYIHTITNRCYHRQPKLTMRVICGAILRNVKMAVNIKDLYGNPGYRFKKISICRNSQKMPYLIYMVCSCLLWNGNPGYRFKKISIRKNSQKCLTLFTWCVLACCVVIFPILCNFSDFFHSRPSTLKEGTMPYTLNLDSRPN